MSPTSYRARGHAYETLGDFEQAKTDYERALLAARQAEDGRLEWQSILDLGVLWTGRDYKRAGAYFQQVVDLSVQLGDAELHAQSLNRLGNWLLNTGQAAEALATHQEALALFEAQHDQPGMAETFDLLGTVYSLGGDPINAALMYGRAIEVLRVVDNRSVLCSCLAMRATFACPWSGFMSCTLNWSFAQCERDVVEALQLAREMQWAAGEAFAEIMFGGICASFGQFGAGLAHAQQGLRLATEINHQQWCVGAPGSAGAPAGALSCGDWAGGGTRTGFGLLDHRVPLRPGRGVCSSGRDSAGRGGAARDAVMGQEPESGDGALFFPVRPGRARSGATAARTRAAPV